MRVIGLTGGVGSGKSRISEILKQEYGAQVIQSDCVAKELERPGQPGYGEIIKRLGTGFLSPDGQIDTSLFSELLFHDKEALLMVNSIIHPLVWQMIRDQIVRSEAAFVVVESALFQENKDDIFDELWYVYTSENNRMLRLRESRGYTEGKCRRIMASQKSEQAYRKIADYVIDNNGSIEAVGGQIADYIAKSRRNFQG